jgi:ABC-type transport system involved in multi-copper enzyme maturation permease subunit
MSDALRLEALRLWRAIDAELFKVVRRRMTYILLLAVGLLVLVSYLLLWWGIRAGPGHRRNALADWLALKTTMSFVRVTPYGLTLERFFATIACVIFAGSLMGNEFDWRTVGLFSAKGVRRWHFVTAKAVVSALFIVVVVMIGFLVAMAASAWFSHLYSLPYGAFDLARLGTAVASLARTVFVMLPLVLLALLFATILRSAGQAVGATLGVYLLEGIFTAILDRTQGWMSHVPEALLNFNGDSVMRANGTFSAEGAGPFIFGSGDAPVLRAALILVLWGVGFVVFALWQFQHRDIQE